MAISNRVKTEMKVECQITRHYGKTSIQLGASAIVNVETPGDWQRAFDELYEAVNKEHARLIDRVAQTNNFRSDAPAPDNKPSNSGNEDTFEVSEIHVEVKDGKRYYKVKGGKYSQWGVRLWPDANVIAPVLTTDDLEEIDKVWTAPDDVVILADVQIANGKVQKVTRLYYQQTDF